MFGIFRVAVRVPVAVGAKVTLSEQLAPAGKLPTQLSASANSEAFAPFIETLVMATVVDSLLVNLTA